MLSDLFTTVFPTLQDLKGLRCFSPFSSIPASFPVFLPIYLSTILIPCFNNILPLNIPPSPPTKSSSSPLSHTPSSPPTNSTPFSNTSSSPLSNTLSFLLPPSFPPKISHSLPTKIPVYVYLPGHTSLFVPDHTHLLTYRNFSPTNLALRPTLLTLFLPFFLSHSTIPILP